MGFQLLLNKALKWGQESWIRGLYKLDFVEEGHVQSGHVGFPLPLNKALKRGQEEFWVCPNWTLWKKDMFRVGKLKAVSLFSCGLCCFAVLLDR